MESTVIRFRNRMAAANSSFIAARIAELRSQPEGTEDEKVDSMSRFWFSTSKLDYHCAWRRLTTEGQQRAATAKVREQWQAEAAVQTLDDVASLPHHRMNGTGPPPDSASRELFLSVLEDLVDDYLDRELLGEQVDIDERVSLPEDLGEFLKYTDGVYDADFRQSQICDFGVCQIFSTAATEEEMYHRLKPRLKPKMWEADGMMWLDWELEVAVGFLVDSSGFWPDEKFCEHMRWFSMLAYCRPVEDLYDKVVDEVLNSDAEPEKFRWRIVFYCRTGDIEYDLYTFETFASFLEWYSSWDERLDENTDWSTVGSL